MSKLFLEMRKDLRHRSTKKHREGALRYFKEEINPYGVRHSDMKELVSKYTPTVKKMGIKRFTPIAERMFEEGWFEEGNLAIKLMEKLKNKFDDDTFKLFDRWVDKYVTNWAHCDGFSAWLVGSLIENKPELAGDVLKWTRSPNRWKRRAAAVSFVVHAKHGRFMDYIFLVSEAMLRDSDDMVQKGVGWLLKESTKSNQKEVVEFIRQRKHKMPRTMLRYAIEKLSPELKRELMKP
ncbi:MAG: DNA alkylation repair protein [Nanoarchaeota archaeon]|nr:DNA alkylation repair protein [Nanoarchaeota archaeon]